MYLPTFVAVARGPAVCVVVSKSYVSKNSYFIYLVGTIEVVEYNKEQLLQYTGQ